MPAAVKKILHVFLDGRTGGPLVRALAVAEALQPEGWRCVMALPSGGDFTEQLRRKGYTYYEIPLSGPRSGRNVVGNLRWILGLPYCIWRLRGIIRREGVTIVHLHGLMSIQAGAAARLCGCKVVWHLSSCLYPHGLARLVMRLVRAWSDRMVIISENIRTYHFGPEHVCDRRITVIQERVDTRVFSPQGVPPESADRYRTQFGIAPGDLVVGAVGNVNPVKDYETLIDAAGRVVERVPQARFVIVGAVLETQRRYLGRLEREIRRRGIEDRFRFAGRLDPQEMPAFLSLVDVFVFTSKAEGGPRVTLEGMAMEKPVVSTRVGDVPCQIDHGQDGYIVDVGDSRGLADRLIELLNDPPKRQMMGTKARKKAEERFALDACVDRHRRVYESLLDEGSLEDRKQPRVA